MLYQSDVAKYLIDRKLITPELVVSGHLTVSDVSRRNCNFKISGDSGRSYFLKQGLEPETKKTLANEARFYDWFWRLNSDSPLQHFLPRLYDYDSDNNVLVLELFVSSKNLREYYLGQKRFSDLVPRQIGQALASLHSLPGLDASDPTTSNTPAWVLNIQSPSFETLQRTSLANVNLIKTIQRHEDFCRRLDELGRDWKIDALIHQDIKLENLLVVRKPGSKKPNLRVVDWELAMPGDACWDLAAVFTGYLSLWLLSLPMAGDDPPERFIHLARFPVQAIQSAARSFWTSYVEQMGFDPETAQQKLLLSCRYAAARLVQVAYEQMAASSELASNIVLLLQVSLNILERPEEATSHLLGIQT